LQRAGSNGERARWPAAQVRSQIEAADALYVKIVDIQNGKATTKRDPHGMEWAVRRWQSKPVDPRHLLVPDMSIVRHCRTQVYDPFARVGFHNPKNNTLGIEHLVAEKFPQIYLPAASHTRTLWCYLRTEEPGWRTAIESALRAWQTQKSHTEQQGTSNAASPAVHMRRATPHGSASGAGGRSQHAPTNLNGQFSGGLRNGGFDHGRRLSTVSEGISEASNSSRPTVDS
jgi:hypothetical protein